MRQKSMQKWWDMYSTTVSCQVYVSFRIQGSFLSRFVCCVYFLFNIFSFSLVFNFHNKPFISIDYFYDFICEDLDYCHPNPCRNGGTCREVNQDVSCTCSSAFKGPRCQGNLVVSFMGGKPHNGMYPKN